MADDISLIVGVDYSELTGLVNTTSQTKRALGSMAKEFANSGSQKNYMAGINKLVAAQKNLDKSARMSRSEIMKLGNQMRQEVKFTNALAGATKSLGVGLNQTKRGTNQLGVMMQQTGYQVGDFAVQVQSGTNFMVAFGQQATQLVGTMAMFAKTTKMIALFSGLGIAIPIISGIAAAFMRTREAADESSLAVKAFEERLKTAKEETAEMTEKLKFLQSGFGTESEFALQEDFAAATAELDRLESRLENAKDPKALFESEASRLTSISLIEKAIALQIQEKDLAEGALETYLETLAALREEEFQREENLRLQKEAEIAAENYDKLVAKTNKSQEQRLELAKRIHHSGKDSLLTAELIARQEGENLGLTEEALANYVAEELAIRSIVAATEEKVAAQKEQDDYFEKIAEALKDGKSLSELNLKSPFEAALPAARLLAETMNLAITDALSLINAATADSGPVGRGRGKTQGAGSTAVEKALLNLGGVKLSPYKKPSGSLKADPAKKAKEAFDSLRASYDKTFASQLKVEKAQKTVNEAMKLGVVSTSDGKKAMEAYKESIKDVKNPMLDMANTISGAFSDAFMSMVEGTKSVKDAFGDMVKVIIKKAFEMAVINPIINSIFGGVRGFNPLPSFGATQANGGAWQGGSQIKAYANGGVVGGPTYFPMAGGKTGLMGEAGPEAIMPLKRGANGKLGVQAEGGGGTTVIQNNTFGSGVTRAEVNAMLPKMVEATKAAVADAKLRGGSYGGAFA